MSDITEPPSAPPSSPPSSGPLSPLRPSPLSLACAHFLTVTTLTRDIHQEALDTLHAKRAGTSITPFQAVTRACLRDRLPFAVESTTMSVNPGLVELHTRILLGYGYMMMELWEEIGAAEEVEEWDTLERVVAGWGRVLEEVTGRVLEGV